MSGQSSDHPIGKEEGKYVDEDERGNDNDKRKVRQENPTPPAAGPSTPRLQCTSSPRVLHNPAPLQLVDLTSTSPGDAPPKPPAFVIHNGRRYDLEVPATTNDRTDAWAPEDDMTAACEQPACDQGRQRHNSYQNDGEAESAVEQVKKYILFEAKKYAQELEKEILQLHQATQPQEDYCLPCGSFQDTPVATKKKQTKKKKLAPVLPRLVAVENKCKHPDWTIVAEMMLRGEEQRDCANCEKEIEIGQYTRCQSCSEVRCKECEWTWMYKTEQKGGRRKDEAAVDTKQQYGETMVRRASKCRFCT
jgi:hypothetical protein